MHLFIDRLPLHRANLSGRESLTVSLPTAITEPGIAVPPSSRSFQRWVFDSGKDGDARCMRCDLEEAGLDPTIRHSLDLRLTTGVGQQIILPRRYAMLWLFSNIPALQEQPFPLELGRGVAFQDVAERRRPDHIPPLIGMLALRRAGCRLQIDFRQATVSLWVPGSHRQAAALFLRRLSSGFSTVPIRW